MRAQKERKESNRKPGSAARCISLPLTVTRPKKRKQSDARKCSSRISLPSTVARPKKGKQSETRKCGSTQGSHGVSLPSTVILLPRKRKQSDTRKCGSMQAGISLPSMVTRPGRRIHQTRGSTVRCSVGFPSTVIRPEKGK